jgi:serine/threonine protein phosphatase PrpC
MPSPPDISIEVFGKTDVGLVREHNEDNFLVADVTGGMRTAEPRAPFSFKLGEKGAALLVCDGMGGAAAGEVASQMAVDSIYDALAASEPQPRDGFARLLRRAVQLANERIFIQSRDNQSERGMGTTCTVASLVDDTLVVAQIGDSRCYVLRDGKLAQVTKDQSLAWQLIEAGAMTADEAKAFEHANIILQALGVQERVEVVLSQVQLRKGDIALLCSDGLHGPVSDEEILAVLIAEPNLQKAGEGLIQKALDRDGPDNITVVLGRFEGDGLQAPAPEDLVGFVGYDPGGDPIPEAVAGTLDSSSLARETVEERLPRDMLTADDIPTKAEPDDPEPTEGRTRKKDKDRPRSGRSLLALFLLALVAAATGGIFVMKCEHDPSSKVTLP